MILYKYYYNKTIYFTVDIKSIPKGIEFTSHEIWC